MKQRRRARRGRARVVEGDEVVDRDQLAPGRETGDDGFSQCPDLVGCKIVGEFGYEDAAPSSVRQFPGSPGAPEPDAGIVAEQPTRGGERRPGAVHCVNPERARGKRPRAGAVAAGKVERRRDDPQPGERPPALQRLYTGVAAAPGIVLRLKLGLKASECDRPAHARISK